MWTGASILTYNMYKGYEKKQFNIDQQWFATYAKKEGLSLSKMKKEDLKWFDQMLWTFGWKAPNVGKLIMGRHLSKKYGNELDKNGYFVIGENGVPISQVSEEMIVSARTPNAIMTVLTIGLVFFIGWQFFHILIGLFGSLFLMLNNDFLMVSIKAGLDGPSIFFGCLTFLFTLYFIKYFFSKGKPAFFLSLLFALFSGIGFALTVGSKLNGALLAYYAIALFAEIIIQLIRLYLVTPSSKESTKKSKRKKTNKKTKKQAKPGLFELSSISSHSLLIGLSAILIILSVRTVFLGTNPQFKSDPVKITKIIRSSVHDFFQIRANGFKQQGRWTDEGSWGKSFKKVAERNFALTNHEMRNNGMRKYYGTLGNLLPFKGNILDGLLIMAGFLFMLVTGTILYFKKQGSKLSFAMALTLFGIFIIYGNTDFLWVDWSRYHMAMYVPFALFAGTGLYFIVWFLSKKIKLLPDISRIIDLR